MTTIGDDTMLDDDQDETAEVPAADLTQDDGTPAADTDVVDADAKSADAESADAESADAESAEGEPEATFDLTEGGEAADGDEDDQVVPPVESSWSRPGKWYVIHSQSGYEKKVKANLEARTQSMNMEEKIFEIVIPMEDVVEFKGGRKQVVQKKVFPGYLLVRCEMDDESWYCIRNTPGVTGFVGQARFDKKPTPLSRREVDTFLAAKGDGQEVAPKRKPKFEYEVGESVRVKEGPFADFSGQVAEINMDHMKLKVLVNIFGRETLVEMDFSQVAKL